jgi:hypothetical protein
VAAAYHSVSVLTQYAAESGINIPVVEENNVINAGSPRVVLFVTTDTFSNHIVL